MEAVAVFHDVPSFERAIDDGDHVDITVLANARNRESGRKSS